MAVEPKPEPVEKEKPVEVAKKPIMAEDFDRFYTKFHTDSNFQMQRINFPVKGFRINNQGEKIEWDKNNWLMHRMKITDVDTSEFKIEVVEKGNIRREILYIPGSGFRTERVFEQKNGKWYLVYFTDENL